LAVLGRVNDANRRSHAFQDELRGKPAWAGVYVSEHLSFACIGKTSRGNAKVKTGIGKSDLPGLQGGPRKRDFVLQDKGRAPRLYPDPTVRSTHFHASLTEVLSGCPDCNS